MSISLARTSTNTYFEGVLMAYIMVKKWRGLSQTVFVWSTNEVFKSLPELHCLPIRFRKVVPDDAQRPHRM